ncbi:septin 7a isoform X5 [Tachysurus ichikawai]
MWNNDILMISKVAQQKNLEGYVGFANLPNQVYRKSVKRGFEFTLMVVASNSAAPSEIWCSNLQLRSLLVPLYNKASALLITP